jgi:hypothetical protein
MAGLLFFGDLLGNGDENFNCEQTHAILIITREVLKQGNHFIYDHWSSQFFDKFGQVVRSLPSYHGRLIVYETPKLLSEGLLQTGRNFAVWDTVKTGGRNL